MAFRGSFDQTFHGLSCDEGQERGDQKQDGPSQKWQGGEEVSMQMPMSMQIRLQMPMLLRQKQSCDATMEPSGEKKTELRLELEDDEMMTPVEPQLSRKRSRKHFWCEENKKRSFPQTDSAQELPQQRRRIETGCCYYMENNHEVDMSMASHGVRDLSLHS